MGETRRFEVGGLPSHTDAKLQFPYLAHPLTDSRTINLTAHHGVLQATDIAN